MRVVAVVLCAALTACGAHSSGPAWPRSAGTERVGVADDDGGESLQPRMSKEIAAVEISSDDDVPVPRVAVAAKPADAGGGATPPVAPTDQEQPVMLDFEDEIIIEVNPGP